MPAEGKERVELAVCTPAGFTPWETGSSLRKMERNLSDSILDAPSAARLAVGAGRGGHTGRGRMRFGRTRHGGSGRRCRRLRLRLLDIDAAFEQRTVLNADPRRDDVADQFGILTDVDLVARLHIALNLAEDNDVP